MLGKKFNSIGYSNCFCFLHDTTITPVVFAGRTGVGSGVTAVVLRARLRRGVTVSHPLSSLVFSVLLLLLIYDGAVAVAAAVADAVAAADAAAVAAADAAEVAASEAAAVLVRRTRTRTQSRNFP